MSRKQNTGKPSSSQPPVASSQYSVELEQRIARLEDRLEEILPGDEVRVERILDRGIDVSGCGDPLQKAVRRSNTRLGSRKA